MCHTVARGMVVVLCFFPPEGKCQTDMMSVAVQLLHGNSCVGMFSAAWQDSLDRNTTPKNAGCTCHNVI
jgi:hypothetical protein